MKIPPLLPEFLTRRRAKMTFALRRSEELGLDRASFIWVLNLSYRGAAGASPAPGDLSSPYSTIADRWMPMAAAAREAGLAEERGGRWHLTDKGRRVAAEMHEAARAHYETLTALPAEELAELARLLDRSFLASAKAAEPRERWHTAFAFAYRGDEPRAGSFAQLDAAVYGLWQVRDDCHMAAWRGAGMSGPDLEVLTRVWRGEAKDESALAELVPHQRAEDVSASLRRLRERGLVDRDAVAVTAEGEHARRGIEEETDRLFFTPWPDDVGAKGDWIAGRLAAVNAALA